MIRIKQLSNSKVVQKQQQRKRSIHLSHLRLIQQSKASSTINVRRINPNKKLYQDEVKTSTIQYENSLLLEKINNIMKANRSYSDKNYIDNHKCAQFVLRKKRNQQISRQNQKLVRRIQNIKSNIPVVKFVNFKSRKNYNKNVLTKISNTTIFASESRTNSLLNKTKYFKHKTQIQNQSSQPFYGCPIQIKQRKIINGYILNIVVRLDKYSLTIKATNSQGISKLIEVNRSEALQYLKRNCGNRIQKIFQKLNFDGQDLQLYEQQTKLSNKQDQKSDNKIEDYEFQRSMQDKIKQQLKNDSDVIRISHF